MAPHAPKNHFQVRAMMSPVLKNGLLSAGDDITHFWKWSCAKKFITSSYDIG
jgi:hypothetical protein